MQNLYGTYVELTPAIKWIEWIEFWIENTQTKDEIHEGMGVAYW